VTFPTKEPKMTESELSKSDKELFLKVWNLDEKEVTDEEILMAIKLGQL
jgi:hypothetical protein